MCHGIRRPITGKCLLCEGKNAEVRQFCPGLNHQSFFPLFESYTSPSVHEPSAGALSQVPFQLSKMAALSRLLAATAICLSLVFTPSLAHPGEHYDEVEVLKVMRARGLEALEQRAQYDGCANSEEAVAREERAILRRAATVQRLREERGLLDG